MIPAWMMRPLSVPVENPDFPSDPTTIAADCRRMARDPRPIKRPVLILGGWRAWWLMPRTIARSLSRLTGQGPEWFIPVAYPWASTFDQACRTARAAISRRFGASVSELDCVGASMGGLVGRMLAAGLDMSGDPLKAHATIPIRRLFTLGTPHRGARLARLLAPDAAARDMRPGAGLLVQLDEALLCSSTPEIIAYARLRDHFVGASRTSPPGDLPRWVSGYLIGSHVTLTRDPRILADIARRLRSEPPLALVGTRPPSD